MITGTVRIGMYKPLWTEWSAGALSECMSGNWKMPIMFRAFVREYLYCTDKYDNLRKQ